MKLFELAFSQLASEFQKRYGKGAYHAAAVFREVFVKGNVDYGEAPEFIRSKGFYERLREDLEIDATPVCETKREGDVTKFATLLRDGLKIESVVIPMATHATLCVSTQAGCKMGCKFCETGRMGFSRNLTTEEIAAQVFKAKFLFGADIRNIVFMGMGEPLDNFDNVVRSILVMEDQRGFDISKRYISVSTAGRVDGIRRLAALNWPRLNLAVSLNAPNDRIRSRIMPINDKYPMAALREAMIDFPAKKNGAVYVEYVLIKNVNDEREHARELAEYLRPVRAKVNLIPYNPGKRPLFDPPDEEEVDRFLEWLVEERVFVRKRSSKGRGIMAACGQLGARESRRISEAPAGTI
jgi:23S rRNA (adenine2503-C2)-methyltransferase